MVSRFDPLLLNMNRRLAGAAGVFTAGLGIIVLVGWILANPYLKSFHPSFVSMKANTALCFLLAGISLILKSFAGKSSRTANIFAFTSTLIGFLTVCQYLTGADFGLDQLLFREDANAVLTLNPGRMAPNTAFSFVLAGAGLLTLDTEVTWVKKIRPADILMSLVWLSGFFALVGYIFESSALYGIARYTRMALPTAMAFTVLGLGGVASRIDKGWLSIIVTQGNGGRVARLLLPIAILTPLIIGFLRLTGQLYGLYDMNFGVALFAISMVILFGIAVYGCALVIDRADALQTKTENDLRQKKEELDRFFTLTLDLLCIASSDGRFLRLNRAWENILGYSLDELIGKIFLDFVHPEDLNDTMACVRVLSEQKEVHSFINRYRHKDGSYRSIEWSSVPCGNLIYAAARDITEREKAETAMMEANKELESFAYSISHDLRAPLRAIDGFTRLLEENYGPSLDEEALRLFSVVRKNTLFMGQLIDDLLAFSRLGRAGLTMIPINMVEKVNSVYHELTTPENRVRIDFKTDDLPVAMGDSALLRQAWTNLLSNAIKYSSRRDRAVIRVSAEQKGDEVIYCVTDNGAGFDKNYAHKLFGVFQRLHSAKEFEGTGVGLAIVHRVIQRHGGRIWADSELDKGATFCFALPRKGVCDHG